MLERFLEIKCKIQLKSFHAFLSDNINNLAAEKILGKEAIINTIKSLKSLLDDGIISEDEFNKKKTELLAKI